TSRRAVHLFKSDLGQNGCLSAAGASGFHRGLETTHTLQGRGHLFLQVRKLLLKPGKVLGKGRVIWRSLDQSGGYGTTLFEGSRRFTPSTLTGEHHREASKGQGEVVLPDGIARVRFREGLSDCKRGPVALQRRRQVALGPQHVADPVAQR